MKYIVLILVLASLAPGVVLAQGTECADPPSCAPLSQACNVELLFRNEGDQCGGAITRTLKTYTCETTYKLIENGMNEAGCPIWSCESIGSSVAGGPNYTHIATYQICGDYRRPIVSGPDEDGNGWYEAAACECSGSCYPAPEVKEVDDDSLFPKNIFDISKLLKLPANLGWTDSAQKLVEQGAPGVACSIGSYGYEVVGGGKTVTGLETENLEDVVGECQLALEQSYEWRVKACLDEGGEDCGVWSGKGAFETSDAPELRSPFDDDFEGERQGSTPFPSSLAWCPVPGTSSFKLSAYEVTSLNPLVKKQVIASGTTGGKTSYSDSSLLGGLNQLQKGISYLWEVARCGSQNLQGCGTKSQLWGFVPGGEFRPPTLLGPPSGSVVNMEDTLSWQGVVFATHYLLDIQEVSSPIFITNNKVLLSNIWNNLSLNSSYTWRVAPCGGSPSSRNVNDCRTEDGSIPWSEQRTFLTTGAQPTNLQVSPLKDGRTAIPVTLSWSGSGGASYLYEITSGSGRMLAQGKTDNASVRVNYEDIDKDALSPGATYSWRVRTCADKQGSVCGPWGNSTLITSALVGPAVTSPTSNTPSYLPSPSFAWEEVFGANFYQYELTYASLSSPQLEQPEASPSCTGLVGSVTVNTVSSSSNTQSMRCTGQYELRVRACTDIACNSPGDWGTPVSFAVQEAPVARGIYGLIPCGTGVNNPNTPWDERESCGFGHILLLVRNLVDFALWKLSLILIALMAIATGAVIYFSFGGTELMVTVKRMWRNVGIGVLILLFAWFLLNILLVFADFNVNAFGQWYEVPFQ